MNDTQSNDEQPPAPGSSRTRWAIAAAAAATAGAAAAELALVDWTPVLARIGANHNESLVRSRRGDRR
jgi:hypothetical protein